jgi:thioredoxin reductase (NADPH)
MIKCELLIVGGGPAGLSAAINAASEGLRVCIIDRADTLGGQARESWAIENFPGFPRGITGESLMRRFAVQAKRFSADITIPVEAHSLAKTESGFVVTSDCATPFEARAILIATGVSYRRHSARNIGLFTGHGVFYGMPRATPNAKGATVVIVGGSNAAGQAVERLALDSSLDIRLVTRSPLAKRMSRYLIDRLEGLANVRVYEGAEIVETQGNDSLERVVLSNGETWSTRAMFIFIGAAPRTQWLRASVALDARGFVKTWHDVSRTALPYETSLAGVFAAGDVRAGSVARVASAIGEGAAVVPWIHQSLAK